MIDHRVAQHPVEPGDRRALVADVIRFLEALHEGILEDVFRESPVAEAPLEEPEEFPVVIDKAGRHIRGCHMVNCNGTPRLTSAFVKGDFT